MHQTIPLVDIFAGPGGLSEGFSAFDMTPGGNGEYPFRSIISAEKEESAFSTLRLRAFVRFFIYGQKEPVVPEVYRDYVVARTRGEKKEPALFLERMLKHSFIEEPVSADELAGLLKTHYPKDYKKIENKYAGELPSILKAAFHARQDVKHFELGGKDLENKSGDITPYIQKSLEHFSDKDTHFVLVGGPPCQAYSNAGRSRRKKGDAKQYTCDETGAYIFDKDPRAILYKEYLKVLSKNRPAIFVMENVRGMLSADFTEADGTTVPVWKRVISELHEPTKALGYEGDDTRYIVTSLVSGKSCYYSGEEGQIDKLDPTEFLVRASDYGVPQDRDRVILLGIRRDLLERTSLEDILKFVKLPAKEKKFATVGQAIHDLPPMFSTLSSIFNVEKRPDRVKGEDRWREWKPRLRLHVNDLLDELSNNVGLKGAGFTESDWSQQLVECFQERGSDRPGKYSAKQLMRLRIYQILEKSLKEIERHDLWDDNACGQSEYKWGVGAETPQSLKTWYSKKSEGLPHLNHYSRAHMDTDLARYIYCAAYAMAYKEIHDIYQDSFHEDNAKEDLKKKFELYDRVTIDELTEVKLDPEHKNKQSFVDRFKVQRAESPSSTVTCHISKDGHYYIHPDPVQCRSLTVREAARLQTFPDDYFFEGTPTQQRTQVGNAVPPLLANKIAQVVSDLWASLNLASGT